MIVGIVICIILTLLSLETGDLLVGAIWGGISIILIYCKANEKKWEEEDRKRKAIKWQEEKNKAAEELHTRAIQRFKNSVLANIVIRDLQLSNWYVFSIFDNGESKSIEIGVEEIYFLLSDHEYKHYKYLDYGLSALGGDGLVELAEYIVSFYPGDDLFVVKHHSVSYSRDDGMGPIRNCSIKRKRPQGKRW